MDSIQYKAVKNLFLDAIEIEQDQINDFLIENCSNPLVLKEVDRLLKTFFSHKKNTKHFEKQVSQTILQSTLFFPNERYVLIKQIGDGGMGSVYLAQRNVENIEQNVAIKILQLNDELSRQRFFQETKILSQLSHPHISQFIDADFLQDGRPYVVMEYIQGKSITEYCQQLEIKKRIHLFIDLCDAVQHVHKHLIIHQDIKPDNILITQNGELKLLDFGISRILGDPKQSTLTLRPAMTPSYASPEQLMGKNISVLSDVYSLGIVLYELLSGTLPHDYQNLSPIEIEKLIRFSSVTKPSIKTPSESAANKKLNKLEINSYVWKKMLKKDLDSIALKALQFDPSERYQSVTELVEDLRNFQYNRPVNARKKRFLYQFKKFIIRNKIAITASILLVSFFLLYIYTITKKNTEINSQLSTISKQRDDLLMEQKRSENIAGTFLHEHYGDFDNNGKENTVINHSVNIGNGNLFHEENLNLKGTPIHFSLYYNSKSAFQTRGGLPVNSIGKGWKHSYSRNLFFGNETFSTARANRPDNTTLIFERIEGNWLNKSNTAHQLIKIKSLWLLTNEKNETEIYNRWGRLIEIKTKEHHFKIDQKQLVRPNENSNTIMKVMKVSTSDGKYFDFSYQSESNIHIQKITDELGRSWTFEYDMFYNLSAIKKPDGTGKRFYYNEPTLPYAMTTVSDILYDGFDIRYVNYDYDHRSRIRRVNYKSNMCENETLDIDYCCETRTVTNSKGEINQYTVKSKDHQWELIKSDVTYKYPVCEPTLKVKWKEQLLK